MGHILVVPSEPRLEGVFYRGVLKTARLEESLVCLEFPPLPGDRFRIDSALDSPGLGQSVRHLEVSERFADLCDPCLFHVYDEPLPGGDV